MGYKFDLFYRISLYFLPHFHTAILPVGKCPLPHRKVTVMTKPTSPALVDSTWLKGNLNQPDLVLLDVRSPPADQLIPGSVQADYGRGWRARVGDAPGHLPDTTALEQLIGGLGIGNDDHVVLIASGASVSDIGNATRVYWTFKALGHDRVSVLDGGIEAWQAQPDVPLTDQPATRPAKSFRADTRPALRATLAEVEAAVAGQTATLLDSRNEAQFKGGVRSPAARVGGTLPNAVHLDSAAVYSPGNLSFATPDAIARLVEDIRIDSTSGAPVVFCNTGHLASVLWFALSELGGVKSARLYDGSMSEWTSDPDRPVQADQG